MDQAAVSHVEHAERRDRQRLGSGAPRRELTDATIRQVVRVEFVSTPGGRKVLLSTAMG
jgi:hypothetical protein